MDKKLKDDIERMVNEYKKLAESLGISVELLLQTVISRELIILNEKIKAA